MSRVVSEAMKKYLASGAIDLIDFWELTRKDGKTFKFTSYSKDIGSYKSVEGWTRSAVEQKLELSSPNSEVQGLVMDGILSETDIRAGLLDGAKIIHFLASPSDANFLTYGRILLPSFYVGETRIEDGTYVLETGGLAYMLQHTFIDVYSTVCRADFADKNTENLCKLDPTDYTIKGTVTHVEVDPLPKFVGLNGRSTIMVSGQTWTAGTNASSPSGDYVFAYQTDGNLVLYRKGVAIWASNTSGMATTSLVMQTDGNLVLYDNATVIFATGTNGNPGATLVLQDDGNLVIYSTGGVALWSTGTNVTEGHLKFSCTISQQAAKADANFNFGLLTWDTGDNAGFSLEIAAASPNFIPTSMTLYLETPFAIEIGDTFTAVGGCGKTTVHCKAHNNIVNMRAEPWIPGLMTLFDYGTTTAG